MNRYIAILRGINVGGKRKILMADLRALFEKMPFSAVSTYIQSGNVLFDYSGNASIAELETQIKEAIDHTYGYDVPVIVFTASTLETAVAANPFYQESDMDINCLHLTFLQALPEQEQLAAIKNFDYPPDRFDIQGQHVFLYCAGKYHKSKYTNQFFEKKLKVTATTRNWKTVLQLLELAKERA